MWAGLIPIAFAAAAWWLAYGLFDSWVIFRVLAEITLASIAATIGWFVARRQVRKDGGSMSKAFWVATIGATLGLVLAPLINDALRT